MTTNFELSLAVLKNLKNIGVEQLIVCAGARNAPLVFAVQALQDHFKFQTTSYFEERSAAFFALGQIRSTGLPVAVLTTSGTAAAELLPAVIEAYYQRAPLVVITADRPKTYRGTAAPQAIEQIGLYSHYVGQSFDLDLDFFSSPTNRSIQLSAVDTNKESFLSLIDLTKPLHLNVCFDEPLMDQPQNEAEVQSLVQKAQTFLQTATTTKASISLDKNSDLDNNSQVLEDLKKIKKPLVISAEIPNGIAASVKNFLLQCQCPIYFESLNELRHDSDLAPFVLRSSDQVLKKSFQAGLFDSVIRIGSVPTLRLWRDLESDLVDVPVFNLAHQGFSGLARTSIQLQASLLNPQNIEKISSSVDLKSWRNQSSEVLEKDRQLTEFKEKLFQKYSWAEPTLFHKLSRQFHQTPVYLGNSLPIRLWDSFATPSYHASTYANRGANGIDGQISTYLGWSQNLKSSAAIIGDLTALYDLAAFGLLSSLPAAERFLVISNNQGGRIFDRVFKGNTTFLNTQQVQLAGLAQLWNLDFSSVESQAGWEQAFQSPKAGKLLKLVELKVDLDQTKSFWDEWDAECKKLKY